MIDSLVFYESLVVLYTIGWFLFDWMDKKNKALKEENNNLKYQLNKYKKTCAGCGHEFYSACSEECKQIIMDETN